MSITTFAALIAQPNTHKIAIAEITIGEESTQTWTLHSGNAYKVTYGTDSITLPSGIVQVLQEEVINVKTYNGTSFVSYTVASSVANCIATSYSWYHDWAAQMLYVNFGGANPNTNTNYIPVMIYFVFRCATEGVSLNPGSGDRFYEPYLQEIPIISQVSNQVLGGYATTSISSISLNNNTGFFDSIVQNYVWENQAITIKYGGEDLPYSEYATVFSGFIIEKSWSRDFISLRLKSAQDKLLDLVPKNIFTTTDYPNMNPQMVGAPRPIAYGTFTQRTGIIPVAIDESTHIASDSVQFMIADHAIFSIDNVYTSYDGGATWTTCSNSGATPPGSANSYTGDAANGKAWVRFIASSYSVANNNRPLVKVAFKGRKNVDTSQMVETADIVQDLLTTYGLFTTSDLDTAEFTDSKMASSASVQIFIDKPTRLADVLDSICISDFASLFIGRAGLWIYRVYEPSRAGAAVTIDDSDIINDSLSVEFIKDDQFTVCRIGYAQANTGATALYGGNENYLYSYASDTRAQRKWGVNSDKVINTYLQNSSDAATLASRNIVVHKTPLATIRGTVKWQLGELDVGDVISITTERAPYVTGSYSSFICELTSLDKDFVNGTISFEAKAIDAITAGLSIGFWTADSAPSWGVATVSEKAVSGFWTNDSGYATAGDPSSYNVSNWW